MEILDDFSYNDNDDETYVWKQFIQENSDKIIPKWKELKKGDSKVSINFFAAFFGIFWVAYRKMYLMTLILGVITIVFPIFIYSNGVSIGTFVMMLLFGDWFYYQHAQTKIREIQSNNFNPEKLQQALNAKGGVSVVLPIAILVLIIVVVFGLALFASSMPL